MAILWFTLAVLIGNYTLHRASKHGLFFVASILLLSALRIFLPLDLNHSFTAKKVIAPEKISQGCSVSAN